MLFQIANEVAKNLPTIIAAHQAGLFNIDPKQLRLVADPKQLRLVAEAKLNDFLNK